MLTFLLAISCQEERYAQCAEYPDNNIKEIHYLFSVGPQEIKQSGTIVLNGDKLTISYVSPRTQDLVTIEYSVEGKFGCWGETIWMGQTGMSEVCGAFPKTTGKMITL
jgi:hypothetical protein